MQITIFEKNRKYTVSLESDNDIEIPREYRNLGIQQDGAVYISLSSYYTATVRDLQSFVRLLNDDSESKDALGERFDVSGDVDKDFVKAVRELIKGYKQSVTLDELISMYKSGEIVYFLGQNRDDQERLEREIDGYTADAFVFYKGGKYSIQEYNIEISDITYNFEHPNHKGDVLAPYYEFFGDGKNTKRTAKVMVKTLMEIAKHELDLYESEEAYEDYDEDDYDEDDIPPFYVTHDGIEFYSRGGQFKKWRTKTERKVKNLQNKLQETSNRVLYKDFVLEFNKLGLDLMNKDYSIGYYVLSTFSSFITDKFHNSEFRDHSLA